MLNKMLQLSRDQRLFKHLFIYSCIIVSIDNQIFNKLYKRHLSLLLCKIFLLYYLSVTTSQPSQYCLIPVSDRQRVSQYDPHNIMLLVPGFGGRLQNYRISSFGMFLISFLMYLIKLDLDRQGLVYQRVVRDNKVVKGGVSEVSAALFTYRWPELCEDHIYIAFFKLIVTNYLVFKLFVKFKVIILFSHLISYKVFISEFVFL